MEKREIKFNPAIVKTKTPKKGKEPVEVSDKVASKGAELGTEPTYGCLKNGAKPTFRQSRSNSVAPEPARATKKTIRHFTSFGKKNETVRILIKDMKSFNQIEKEKKKLEKHSLAEVCAYLIKRNLYQAGSDAPEEVLRETYRNAYLAGNVHNNNPNIMLNNFMHGGGGGAE
jgi:hypothetical protein